MKSFLLEFYIFNKSIEPTNQCSTTHPGFRTMLFPPFFLFLFSCCFASSTIDLDSFEAIGDIKISRLMILCKNGSILDIKNLIIESENVNYVSPNGQTALHVAAEHNRPDVIFLLSLFGASLDMEDLLHHTPLHIALVNESSNAVKALLKLGAKASMINGSYVPLHFAISLKNEDIINSLIRDGFHLSNEKNYLGETALHFAIKNGDIRTANLLIDNGHSLVVVTFNSKTPLDYIEERIESNPEEKNSLDDLTIKMALKMALNK